MAAMPKLHHAERGLRILVVSGSDDAEIAGASAYKDRAVTLIYASNLEEARHAVVADDVDVVLIDYGLARTFGRDIRRQLAGCSLRIPVIVLLEEDAVVEVKEAIAIGADGFYYKRQIYSWLFDGQEEALDG